MESQSGKWIQMLDKAGESKQDFIDYLEFTDKYVKEEAFYEEIMSWAENRVMLFLDWWDWDLNTIDLSVWEYCELIK